MRRVHLLPGGGIRRRAARILVLVFACSATPVSTRAEQDMVEIRGERMPVWPAEDLRERGYDVADIPREDNAAWVYLEACNSFLDVPEELHPAHEYALKTAWPENQPRLRKWVARKENREAIKLAREAARMERCRMPYFGDPDGSVISVLLPNLRHHRTLAKLLVVDGRRLVTQKDYRGAMDNFATAMRMGHHVSQGITLIESLVGIACWNLGQRTVRDMVLRHDVPATDLADLFEEWRQLKRLMPTVQRGFEAERLFGPNYVDEVVSSPSRLLSNFQLLHNYEVPGGRVKPRDGWDRLEARLGHVFLPDRTVKRHMAQYYDAWIELARLPYHDERAWNFDEEQLIKRIPRWDALSRVLLPSLSRARVLAARSQTETRATTVAFALRLHAVQNRGKLPAELADLAVELDADDLIDPFSGGAFRYARTSDGWMLYSVGPDRSDDGGHSGDRWDDVDTDMVCAFPPEPIEAFEPDED